MGQMAYPALADLVMVMHFAFILFVVLGGALMLRWRRVIWLHLPAATWGCLVILMGWRCPLTPFENWLRGRVDGTGYEGNFIAHYLGAVIYPAGLTREIQILLGCAVLLINAAVYFRFWQTRHR